MLDRKSNRETLNNLLSINKTLNAVSVFVLNHFQFNGKDLHAIIEIKKSLHDVKLLIFNQLLFGESAPGSKLCCFLKASSMLMLDIAEY